LSNVQFNHKTHLNAFLIRRSAPENLRLVVLCTARHQTRLLGRKATSFCGQIKVWQNSFPRRKAYPSKDFSINQCI
jgi:hypothetical protein